MTDEAPTSPPLLEELAACLRVLRAVEHDRSVLTQLSAVQRRELLTLAGLVSKPERHDLVKMAKAFRRAEREATKQRDRQAIAQAGLRLQRRAEVYKPLWLEPPHAKYRPPCALNLTPRAAAMSARHLTPRYTATTMQCVQHVAISIIASALKLQTSRVSTR